MNIEKITGAKPAELKAAFLSFAFFFCLLASYYVLRPIRDELSIQIVKVHGKQAIAELFTFVFLTLLAITPLFGWLTGQFARKKLIPWFHVFFAANLVGFYFLFAVGEQTQNADLARGFYVWVSVFNLFIISIFWSFMADIFETEQAKRIYGFIAAGGTVGAVVGPLITSNLVATLGAKNLMLVAAGFLMIPLVLIPLLLRWEKENQADAAAIARNAEEDKPLGGSIFAGLRDVLTDRYLLAICLFILLYALMSSVLYFAQLDMLGANIKSSNERTQLLAKVDLTVNLLTLFFQVFAFSAVLKKLGTRFMLVAMPLISLVGFVAMASAPLLTVLLAFGIVRRAGEYAVSKPARETLFNVLPAEQKYKAKNVIDTLVQRTGDVSSSWVITGLTKVGLSLSQLNWLAVPASALWFGVAWWLGGQAQRRQKILEPH
jgi:ATP:ADP antiporter, AAA family